MKKFFIVIIIIILLMSLDIWVNRKELFNIVTVDDILNDLNEFKEKYQGIQRGDDIGNFILKLWTRTQEIIRSPRLAKKINDLPTIILHNENETIEARYQNDAKLYSKNLDKIASKIDSETYFNVDISCNSEEIPTKIVISQYNYYVEID